MSTTEEREVYVRGRDRSFTWEEYNELSDAIMKAGEQGDIEKFDQLVSQFPLSADVLAAFTKAYGKDFITDFNLDTTRADEKFGKGWIDGQ